MFAAMERREIGNAQPQERPVVVRQRVVIEAHAADSLPPELGIPRGITRPRRERGRSIGRCCRRSTHAQHHNQGHGNSYSWHRLHLVRRNVDLTHPPGPEDIVREVECTQEPEGMPMSGHYPGQPGQPTRR